MTRVLRLLAAALLLLALTGSRCTVGEAGAPPQQGTPHARNLYLLAEGTGGEAHIYIKIGGQVLVDDLRPLPFRTDARLEPTEFLEFEVTAVAWHGEDAVRCTIMTTAGKILDEAGPGSSAKCALVALQQPA